jgi:hypothetical protein
MWQNSAMELQEKMLLRFTAFFLETRLQNFAKYFVRILGNGVSRKIAFKIYPALSEG